jgi:hypothetical protein
VIQESNEFSRHVCVDGTILEIPVGGHVELKMVPSVGVPALKLYG